MTAATSRAVRVFVSSTFRDMKAERDELAKFVFPQLRKLCETRGVTWGEVDLRWGITEEQKAEGKVLPICLEEIRRCRPYFIGLLGERYGWVPDEIPAELIEQEPWLREHLEHSVTELEILHGVLRNPEMAAHAFFYFRDPAYIDSLPREERGNFREEAPDQRAKLVAMKRRIRDGGFPVEEDYAHPKALGGLVLRDLTAVIDRLYPEGSRPDPLEREAAEHEAFARSRSGVYIGRAECFERLDANAEGEGPPLVVTGGSGSGKSALLANWAIRYRESHPEELLVMHFIGGSPYSTDWAGMLRRIMGEISRRFGIEQEIPGEPDALRRGFANLLRTAAAGGRVVLVLDALDQLEDRDGAPDLLWLPPEVPENVRLVVATLPGRPLDELAKRDWPMLEVEPLEPAERKRLVQDYLRGYSRELSADRVERIAAASQTASPLYLRALLEELRLWGEYETLDRAIGHYLEAAGIPDLYELILARYECDYDRERPGLVRDSFSLVFAARRGLSEAELLDLLGKDGKPLPRAHWSPLYLAVESSLVARSGLIGFFHDYLRQAVEHRYLPAEEDRRAVHLRLADYFDSRRESSRGVDELPWQLAEAASWRRLSDLLADLPFLGSAWNEDEFGVKGYWVKVEEGSDLRLVDAYRSLTQDLWSAPGQAVWTVAALLADTGHPDEAFLLQEHLAERFRRDGDIAGLQAALGNQAVILKDRGELDRATELLEEQERICRELGNAAGLQASLNNQALILYARGELDRAMPLLEEQERICRELGDLDGLQRSLGNQAIILYARGELDQAMALHKEEERICRELGDPAGLQASLGNQAAILYDRGEPDQAMALDREKERICRELGNPAGLARSLANQANILYDRGELDQAMTLYGEAERIFRELHDVAGLSASLNNQARIPRDRGELDQAMALYGEAERICRELGDPAGLARSLGHQAAILLVHGELDQAMESLEEQERICREFGDPAGLQASLGNQAVILKARGELDQAMELLEEQERICRELGDPASLQASLGNQANILRARGELGQAMALNKEQERICRELGDPAGLAVSLNNQAAILLARGEYDEAMVLLKEQERICRELGDSASLQASLGNQALILQDRGELDQAMALHKEQERICRELGNPAGLAISLVNQGRLLSQLGRRQEGVALVEEALQTATTHGLRSLAQRLARTLQEMR